nr:MiaB/RimO family radical SAM methylthiotransferase [Desulfovibrionaceae bacterium]
LSYYIFTLFSTCFFLESALLYSLMNFSIYTLGCKINQYESECIIQAWQSYGLKYVHELAETDIFVINSCAVTESAVKEAKKLVEKLVKNQFQGRIILTGCATQLLDTLQTEGVEYITVLQEEKETLLEYPKQILSQYDLPSQNQAHTEYEEETLLATTEEEPFVLTSSLRARATVKVHDGCSHRCTYCIIPYTRGPSRSRSLSAIISEIRGLLEQGHREIILSGINLRQFGADFTFPMDFWDLIARLEHEFASEWHTHARFRISSLEPCQLNDKALDTLAQAQLVCPHLHISLQSASYNVLKKMARGHYSVDMLYDALDGLKQIWNIFALGVDIITGFPGETDDDFILTQESLISLPITYAHIFPFSERPFTQAPTMKDQIYPHIRKERAKLLRSIAQEKHRSFMEMLVTKQLPQHIVSEKNNPYAGISQYYIECKKQTPFLDVAIPHTPIAYYDTYIDVQ